MKDKIIQQIKDKFDKTHCGITIIQLSELNQTPYFEIKKILVELQKEKIIRVRQGINLKLIYLR
jgi:hypothetical protein